MFWVGSLLAVKLGVTILLHASLEDVVMAKLSLCSVAHGKDWSRIDWVQDLNLCHIDHRSVNN